MSKNFFVFLLSVPYFYFSGYIGLFGDPHLVTLRSISFFLLLIFFYVEKISIMNVLKPILPFLVVTFGITILNRADLYSYMLFIMHCVFMILLAYLLILKSKLRNILSGYFILSGVLGLLFLNYQFGSDGYDNEVRFWGTRNVMGELLIPILTFSLFCNELKKYKNKFMKRYVDILILILFIYPLFYYKSSTAQSVSFIFLLLLILREKFKQNSYVLYKRSFIIIGCLFLVIQFMQLSFLNNILSSWFDKDATFSNRTLLWAQAYISIFKSPLIGYGYDSLETKNFELLGQELTFSAHNMILELILYFGVIGFCSFGYYVYVSFLKIKKISGIVPRSLYILLVGNFCFLIYYLFEARSSIGMFVFVLSFIINYQKIKYNEINSNYN